MENKKRFFYLLIALPFIVFSAFPAYSSPNDGNFTESQEAGSEIGIEEEEDAESKWQYLEWKEENPEFVLKYEVVIEEYSEKKKSFHEINRIFSDGNTPSVQVQPLLSPGTYRYKVITYNLIGVPEVESDYFDFKIYMAFQPEISGVSTSRNLSSTIYLEEINDGIFNVTGKNLFFTRQDESDTSFTTYYLVNSDGTEKKRLFPKILETDEKHRRLKLQFDMKNLEVGTYKLIAQDASGLKSEINKKDEIIVKFKKRIDYDLSAGYTCPVILYDDTFMTYLKSSVYPLSFYAKFSVLPFKRGYGYLGMGVSGTYTRMSASLDSYKIKGTLFTSGVNFVYQRPLRIKMKKSENTRHYATLELHAGPQIVFFNDYKFTFKNGVSSTPLNSLNFGLMAGGAAQFYITNRLYTELSVDYSMAFVKDMPFGAIYPSLGLGWQF